MSGIAVVYVVFAIVIACIFGYTFLMSQRQREIEAEMDELREILADKQDGR